MDLHDIIMQGIHMLGLSASDHQVDQLSRYCREIERWNPRFNLVRSSGRDFIHRHVFDALSAVPALTEDPSSACFSAADIGSGNGIPGIPLAVLLPGCSFTLVERSAKRCGFLRNAAAVCGLYPRVKVLEEDVRTASLQVSLITFRAVSSLGYLLPLVLPLLGPGGRIAAYKGREQQVIQELADAGLDPEGEQVQTVNLANPFLPDHQRQLVIISPGN